MCSLDSALSLPESRPPCFTLIVSLSSPVRGNALLRTTPVITSSWQNTPTFRIAACASSTTLDLTPPPKRCYPGRVLKRAYRITSSGCWRPVDRHGGVDIVEKDVSPTQDPEPSQPTPRHAEFEPEPTADDEPEPRATELKIATEPEPEPYTSDQVQEPATSTVTGECNMEQVRAMESPAHCTTAGGELDDNSGDLIDFSTKDLENNSGDLIDFFSEVSICSDLPVCMEFPPTLPLLPMSTYVCSPLSPDSPSAHPQPTTCEVGSPRVCQLPSASWLEDPSAPPPASESRTPPRPSDPAAPPRLSAPSSPPSPVGPPAPPGSLVPPAPPWSVVVPPSPRDSTPLALPRRSIPPAPLGSSLPPAPPQSSVAPALPRTSGAPPPPQSPEPSFGSPSPPRAPPPPAPPPSVGPLESSALPPPWLLPPSAPPWAYIMAAVWVSTGSSCSGSLLFPPWLLPPSSPPWTLFFALITLFFLSPSRGSVLRRSLLPHGLCLSSVFSPLLSVLFFVFYGARSRLAGGGR
ncbi:Streptococcal surface protein A [Labeo rohita]|uniref:Streptococcal surface protein A n=1 Tax=Labeo rohita TaxID=84645 RepID=A0ABQ8L6E3_LABRO|nr:Streptococcal surface protein A [Labeo rohita]